MSNNIFTVNSIPGGYTYSIISQLHNILSYAENLYGERDKSFTILGVEITTEPIPQIWFPRNGRDVIIQITESCMNDMPQAIYQVSHEIIHCFNPCKFGEATVLEEGLATSFASQYMQMTYNQDWFSHNPRLNNAKYLVEQLTIPDPNIIKRLRIKEPAISKITKELILQECDTISLEIIEQLVTPF